MISLFLEPGARKELQRLDKEIQKVLKSIDGLCMCMAVYLIKLNIF